MAADNVPITAGAGTSVRTFADASGNEWPSGVLCYATTVSPGANVLQPVMPAFPLPITLPAAQVTTLTPPAAITGFATATNQTTANSSLGTIATNTAGLAVESGGHLASVDGKITACNTGAVVLAAGVASIGLIANTTFAVTQGSTWSVNLANSIPAGTNAIGSITNTSFVANAGTNLNTSLLALETGGNLATIAGKDFATQTTLSALNAKVTACNTGAVAVSSSALPTGAATAAKQPALGTAGTPSTDVLTIQGVASGTPIPTTANPVRGALTNRSGTVTTGGTSQVLAASNSTRSYLFVLNPASATESLWIDFTTSAVAASPSIELQPGQSFTMEHRFASVEAVNVIAATTAHAFTAKEG